MKAITSSEHSLGLILLYITAHQGVQVTYGQADPGTQRAPSAWFPLSEQMFQSLTPQVQRLVSGAVDNLGPLQHLSLVFIGCALSMQHRMRFSDGNQRVTFRRDVPPTTHMVPAQRELVIS